MTQETNPVDHHYYLKQRPIQFQQPVERQQRHPRLGQSRWESGLRVL